MHWFAGLLFTERRSAERHSQPRLAAYYWDGNQPAPYSVRDISSAGLYLVTKDRWHPGTVLMITLQGFSSTGDGGSAPSIRVQAKVIRQGDDGVAFAFIFPNALKAHDGTLAFQGADRKAIRAFARDAFSR